MHCQHMFVTSCSHLLFSYDTCFSVTRSWQVAVAAGGLGALCELLVFSQLKRSTFPSKPLQHGSTVESNIMLDVHLLLQAAVCWAIRASAASQAWRG